MSEQGRRERGADLVEFALILPLLMLFLLGVVDFGRAVYAYSVVGNAAREGARYGIIHWDDADGQGESRIQCRAKELATGLDTSLMTVVVTLPTEEQETVEVEVTYIFRLFTPLVAEAIGRDTVLLRSTATMYTGY